ncbi:MAG: type VI secretion system tube protein Hcp, partial [Deltaproteobacteria bacterium]|nr:type VI secretion system tube protein Hcp [Deltaproteobacteria bacterium]
MPMPCHMSVTGKNQGKIEGSCDIQGREGTILIYAVDHTVEIPRDTHTGLPTGKRIHL